MTRDHEESENHGTHDSGSHGRPGDRGFSRQPVKRVTFDDFQITRNLQQKQVEEERRVWQERQERIEQQKPAILRMAGSRLRSVRDEMIGGGGPLSFLRRGKKGEERVDDEPTADEPTEAERNAVERNTVEPRPSASARDVSRPYFADHEQNGVRVVRQHDDDEEDEFEAVDADDDRALIESYYSADHDEEYEEETEEEAEDESDDRYYEERAQAESAQAERVERTEANRDEQLESYDDYDEYDEEEGEAPGSDARYGDVSYSEAADREEEEEFERQEAELREQEHWEREHREREMMRDARGQRSSVDASEEEELDRREEARELSPAVRRLYEHDVREQWEESEAGEEIADDDHYGVQDQRQAEEVESVFDEEIEQELIEEHERESMPAGEVSGASYSDDSPAFRGTLSERDAEERAAAAAKPQAKKSSSEPEYAEPQYSEEESTEYAAEDSTEYSAEYSEPEIESSLSAFMDALRAFESRPRRAFEPRDPRADFVLLLGELLDILREQVNATSAMFFWVNTRRQQLVLESAALDDVAYQNLASDKRFSIELDAVSRVVSKRKPELLSSIPPQAELDLIPYYRDSIGVSSFAGMPVLFGDGIVAVLTVDSVIEDNFTPETLRILTSYSKLISGLIRSYIEKYDLLASARTLESARKLHQMVSPESSQRLLREQRKNPDYVLRALTEAVSEILDWDWLATAAFDDTRRIWSISSLQAKQNGSYVPPQTPISLGESIVGKCLSTGRSSRHDALTSQSIRFNTEEERSGSVGHSFLTIPIRTSTKNYGALAIEHGERARFTDADVETLEHLTRSAASALEIIALSEIVGERALTDLLSGLLNKRGLLQRLNEELSRAMEYDEPLTLVLFEIDGASEFFARFSQEDSDTVVLAIARLLRFGSRAFDVVARVGEHSFAALLIKMTDEEAYLWSEKMRKMIVSEVIAIGKRSFSVTVSIGVAGARRDGTVEELVEGAELAIERAKELGGNNVIVY